MGDARKHNILFFEHNLTDPKETGPSHAWLIQSERGATRWLHARLLATLAIPFLATTLFMRISRNWLIFFNQEATTSFLREVGRIFASIGCRENNNVFCIIEIIINTRGQMTNCPLQNALFCGPNGKCAGWKYICRPDADWMQRCQTTSLGQWDPEDTISMPELGRVFVDEFALAHFVALQCTFDVWRFYFKMEEVPNSQLFFKVKTRI